MRTSSGIRHSVLSQPHSVDTNCLPPVPIVRCLFFIFRAFQCPYSGWLLINSLTPALCHAAMPRMSTFNGSDSNRDRSAAGYVFATLGTSHSRLGVRVRGESMV